MQINDTLLNVFKKYGAGSTDLKIGDKVLTEGCDYNGRHYIILCVITQVEAESVMLREEKKWYFPGDEVPFTPDRESASNRKYLAKSITDRLREGIDFMQWLAQRMKDDEKKYGA